MMVSASELGPYIGKPVGVMSGLDAFAGELMGAERKGDDVKVVLFHEDEYGVRTHILTMDLDKQVDVMVD